MASTENGISVSKLVLVPAIITLGVTLLRLTGELQHWSPTLFSHAPGGGGALVGISWLPLFFGVYFAWRLCQAGEGPASPGRAILFTVIGLIVMVGGGFLLAMGASRRSTGIVLCAYAVMVAATLVQRAGWPSLFSVLLAYGLLARIPSAVVYFLAFRGNWGTHYDAVPPNFPADVSLGTKFLQLGLFPQLFLWIPFTILVGALFGSLVTAILGWNRRQAGAVA